MHYFVLCAGIPRAIYDEVNKVNATTLVGDRASFVARPLYPDPDGKYRYQPNYSKELIKKLYLELQEYIQDNPRREFYLFLVYIEHEIDTIQILLSQFFPFAFPVGIPSLGILEGIKERERQKRKNICIRYIQQASKELRSRVGYIRKELDNRNHTPLLLPIRNFQSKCARKILFEFYSKLSLHGNISDLIVKYKECFETFHQRIKYNNKLYFVDERNLVFKSPNSTELHGTPWPKLKDRHSEACYLSGRVRFGVPFHASFHYDCVDLLNKPITDRFENCHGDIELVRSRSYVNIAPNDYIG